MNLWDSLTESERLAFEADYRATFGDPATSFEVEDYYDATHFDHQLLATASPSTCIERTPKFGRFRVHGFNRLSRLNEYLVESIDRLAYAISRESGLSLSAFQVGLNPVLDFDPAKFDGLNSSTFVNQIARAAREFVRVNQRVMSDEEAADLAVALLAPYFNYDQSSY